MLLLLLLLALPCVWTPGRPQQYVQWQNANSSSWTLALHSVPQHTITTLCNLCLSVCVYKSVIPLSSHYVDQQHVIGIHVNILSKGYFNSKKHPTLKKLPYNRIQLLVLSDWAFFNHSHYYYYYHHNYYYHDTVQLSSDRLSGL